MLQNIRDRFTGGFAVAILALLCVPFAFFGINYNFMGSGYAAKVEGVEIPLTQLQQAYQSALARYAESGNELPQELNSLVRESVLTNLIRETLVNLHLNDQGYRISNEMITDFIRQVPEFQENGTFSKELYYSWLGQQFMNAQQFEESRRQAMKFSQFQRGIAATAFVTPAEYRRYLNLYGQQRQAAVATFDVDETAENIEVTDEEVAAYYEAHPEEFQAPESVDIAYIALDRNELREKVEIGEQELQAYYEQSASRYLQDEQRQARHILIPFGDDEEAARKQAEALAARARAGEPFADLAQQYSADGGTAEQGGDLGMVTKSQMPDALGNAIFSMSEGEIAGPVRSDFGFHVIKLEETQPGGPLPLEQVRAELERELRDVQVDQQYRELERKLSDALFESQDLQSMAEAVGLEVETAEGFTRSGGEPFGRNQAAIDAVFDDQVLDSGMISEIVELDADRMAVFKVREHHEAALRPLEEVREGIVAKIRSDQAHKMVRERALELQAALADGADFETAAKEAGAEVTPLTMVGRMDQEFDPRVLEAIFRAPKPKPDSPSIGHAVTDSGDHAIYSIVDVVPGRPEAIPLDQRDQGKLQLAAESGRADYTAFVLELARDADVVRSIDALNEPAF